MSFIDDLVDLGKSAVGYLSGNSLGANLAKTALTTYALTKVYSAVNKDNEKNKDTGNRVQLDPSTENAIPVLYGTAFATGIITDAVISTDNLTMWYVLTICEKTGNINLGAGAASTFAFKNIYWNDERLVFKSDGVTVASSVARDTAGTINTDLDGLVQVYCFAGNSSTPVTPTGYINAGLQSAITVMQDSGIPSAVRWTSNHTMSDLVFAIVKVSYDAEKSVRELGDMKFQIENSMTEPGDCIYDYMTNTRYGAGIDSAEINSITV